MRMTIAAFLAVLLFTLPLSEVHGQVSVVDAGRLLDVDSGRLQADRRILIVDGRIE